MHNDIKPDNILLSDTYKKSESDEQPLCVILIDFGKATSISNGKRYHLTPIDQADYISRPQSSFYLAPEVINGESKQSIFSDVFALGGVFYRILDKDKLAAFPDHSKKINNFAEQCRSVHYCQ